MTRTSIFDWTIYQNLFSAPEMEAVFDEAGTIASWVEVERAVARAQAKIGIAPNAFAKEIDNKLRAEKIDLQRLQASTKKIGRPIVGLIEQLKEQVDSEAREWVHYGITTYDTMDTGRSLQLRDGLILIKASLARFQAQLIQLAKAHRNTLMIGRTNNLHAQPMTFGTKLATWIEECLRHQERLDALEARALVIQFGGAVGTLASLGDKGLAFRDAVAEELGLHSVTSNWHNARDGIVETGQVLGLICASLARIGQGVNMLESTEIGELAEMGDIGRGKSTTMAHKNNPRAAEFTEAVARLGRHRSTGLIEVMGQDHDRCGGTWIAEWALVPEVFLLTSGALSWANELAERLQVNEGRMRANIDLTNGLALSECYTHALAEHIPKTQARALIEAAVLIVRETGTSLPETLKSMQEVTDILSAKQIQALSLPENYVGVGPEMLDNVLALANEKGKRES